MAFFWSPMLTLVYVPTSTSTLLTALQQEQWRSFSGSSWDVISQIFFNIMFFTLSLWQNWLFFYSFVFHTSQSWCGSISVCSFDFQFCIFKYQLSRVFILIFFFYNNLWCRLNLVSGGCFHSVVTVDSFDVPGLKMSFSQRLITKLAFKLSFEHVFQTTCPNKQEANWS